MNKFTLPKWETVRSGSQSWTILRKLHEDYGHEPYCDLICGVGDFPERIALCLNACDGIPTDVLKNRDVESQVWRGHLFDLCVKWLVTNGYDPQGIS